MSIGLGASLDGEEALFGERRREVGIWEANVWWLKRVWGEETKRRQASWNGEWQERDSVGEDVV